MGDEITDIETDSDDDDKSSIYEPFTAFNPVRSKSVLANAGVGYSSDSSVKPWKIAQLLSKLIKFHVFVT